MLNFFEIIIYHITFINCIYFKINIILYLFICNFYHYCYLYFLHLVLSAIIPGLLVKCELVGDKSKFALVDVKCFLSTDLYIYKYY